MTPDDRPNPVLVLALGLVLAASLVVLALVPHHKPRNSSTDGRAHTCGYVTAEGVTDHLAEYRARCGEVTP